jgi:hypothetical protein
MFCSILAGAESCIDNAATDSVTMFTVVNYVSDVVSYIIVKSTEYK